MSDLRRGCMVVKVGSQALCDADGTLDETVLAVLAGQVSQLWAHGWRVLLVSSGAVAAGMATGQRDWHTIRNPVTRKQVLAATGQVRLMDTWQRHFTANNRLIAQVLASKSDFQGRDHYLNMRACIEGLLDTGITPVVNENDVVAVTELMFTDNDELAGLMAGLVGASHLALLSAVDGVLDTATGEVIPEWKEGHHETDELVRSGVSRLGRGGMRSKIVVALRTASLGTETVIANGRVDNVLMDFADGKDVGTRFKAAGIASPARRWLASMDDHALGAVTVNPGAAQALLDPERLASLLPVGLTAVEGEFQRGDVIQVRSEDGRVLGCGRAQYDHRQAVDLLGQHGQKPVIHYDYLYLVESDER